MILDRLVDPAEGVLAAIGRPRTALWIGGASHSSLAEEVGARVERDGPDSTPGPFDLAFLTSATSAGPELGRTLASVERRLADGGHVVVEHDRSTAGATVPDAMRRAALEPLWRHVRGEWTLTVGRRPPEKRRLSLTVGMISMNEAAAVGKVIDAIREANVAAEILLVDSSKDETPAIAEQKGARVLRQFPPRGYGPAMTRLLYSATTDVIVTMDCDGTYPTAPIRELLERIESGADLVNASRTHRRPKTMPLANYIANRAFAAVAGIVHRHWTTDLHSGMRAYRTSMLRGIHVSEKGPALPVELLLVPARHGYRVEDIDITYLERVGTTTLHRWDSTVWTFRRIANAALRGGSPIDRA